MYSPKRRRLLHLLLLLLIASCHGWEWSDLVVGGSATSKSSTLTLNQVSEMRVRDIKRRLARQHGYGADELARMLDKKELIHALAYEEYKVHQKQVAEVERLLIKRGIIVAIVAVLLVLFWPLLQHVWEVAHVNWVVYTDRKLHEAKKCWEFKSIVGGLGVFIMAVLDIMGLWLTLTVLLSWIMARKWYFFPIPSLPIRPAQFMGGEVASGPLSRYGINTGPMVITWLLRFLHGRVETWVGRALLRSQKASKKAKKKKKKTAEMAGEKEKRAAAKAKRRAAREEAKQQQEQQGKEQQTQQQPQEIQQQQESRPGQQQDESTQPSRDEARNAAATAAEARWNGQFEPKMESAFDDLD